MFQGRIPLILCGCTIQVEVTIFETWHAVCEFTLYGRPYTFLLKKWQSRGLQRFLHLLAEYHPDGEFGTVDDEGLWTSPGNISEHEVKQRAVLQGVRDVFNVIDNIHTKHGRGILDYAIWYREKYDAADTYSNYISLVACYCLMHTEFMAPAAAWEIVEL